MISAVILAAGASQRMGSPKALLKIGDATFLQHISAVLSSVRITTQAIVLGSDAGRIQPSLSWFSGKVVINEGWEKGQLSSICCGLDAVEGPDCHGILLWPVDRPFVTGIVCVDLLQAFWTSGRQIVVPVHHGKRGHPVLFGASLFDELRALPHDVGARGILHRHPGDVYEVETSEEGTILNIDTPEDYNSAIRKISQ